MERIVLRDIILNHNRIEYITENSEGIADAFRKPFEYWIEYNENVEAVPTSIAVIPFVCNVLPIVWVMDAELFVPEIDEDFYNSLENTRDAYIKMYPNIQFKGKLSAAKIVKNVKTFHNEKKKATAFFSGGVDSWATLVSHIGEDELAALGNLRIGVAGSPFLPVLGHRCRLQLAGSKSLVPNNRFLAAAL